MEVGGAHVVLMHERNRGFVARCHSFLRGILLSAALAGLALLSLVMMVRLVRKSARAMELLPGDLGYEEESGARPAAELAEVIEGRRDGQEADEDTVRYRKLSRQVSEMVEEDPQTAADLIRQWIGGS